MSWKIIKCRREKKLWRRHGRTDCTERMERTNSMESIESPGGSADRIIHTSQTQIRCRAETSYVGLTHVTTCPSGDVCLGVCPVRPVRVVLVRLNCVCANLDRVLCAWLVVPLYSTWFSSRFDGQVIDCSTCVFVFIPSRLFCFCYFSFVNIRFQFLGLFLTGKS